MEKIELVKKLKDLYTATNTIKEVVAERAVFLCVDGQGKPGGEAFQQAVGMVYPVVYTAKFTLKHAGVLDFAVSRLECLYDVPDAKNTPMSEWQWRVLIRIPEEVTKTHVAEAKKTVREKKGLDCSAVKRVSWREGRALQVMHTGPYDQVSGAYERLVAEAGELGYRVKGPGHEIYISDPCRVAPEKLKTIVRLPVAHPRPSYARG